MAKSIRGITVEIGGSTNGLQKALNKVNKSTREVQGELKTVDQLLKFNPASTELVAQKQELLAKQIDNTSDRLKVLKSAQAEVDKQFRSGKIDEEQYRQFNRELVQTESKLKGLKDQLEQTGRAQKELESKTKQLETLFKATGTSVDDFADTLGVGLTNAIRKGTASSKQIDDAIEKIGKASLGASADVDKIREALRQVDKGASVNKVKKNLDGIARSANKAAREADDLKNSLKGIGAGVGAAGAAGTAAAGGLVAGMQEYNQDLARLRTNAELAGNDLKLVEDAFKQITTVTGEADSAVETVSNLLASGFKDNQLAGMIDQINGAAIKFSDTLKTEGIADGLQETFATGEAIGQFGELLDRSGVDVEKFNEQLGKAKKQGNETEFVMKTLADLGFGAVTEKYKELNPEVQANAEANAELQKSMADLAIVITPLIVQVTEFITKIADWAAENPELMKMLVMVAGALTVLMGTFALLSPIVTAFTTLAGFLGVGLGALIGPVLAVIAGITAFVAAIVYAYQNSETFRNGVQTAFEKIKEVALQVFEVVAEFIGEKIAQIKQFWDDNGPMILEAVQNVFNGIKEVIEFVMPFVLDLIKGIWEAIKNVINGALDIIMGVVKVFAGLFTGDFSKMWEGIKQMFSGAVEAIWGLLQLGFLGRIFKVIQGFGGKAFDAIKNMGSKMRGTFDDIVRWATDKFNAAKDAILRPIQAARDTIKGIVDNIKGFFSGLKLKLPKIEMPKLPHFSLKGKFSLNPPSVPKLGVDWYDKGGVFYGPQVIGVGEKRPEFVGALDDLRAIVSDSMRSVMNGGSTTNNQSSVTINNADMMRGATIVIREDADIGKIARELYNLQVREARRNGVIMRGN